RRSRHHCALCESEIERAMMSFEAPGPWIFCRRRTKDRDVIELGIARRSASLLHLAKDVLERHDGGRLEVTRLAETGVKQFECELPLVGAELLHRQALA